MVVAWSGVGAGSYTIVLRGFPSLVVLFIAYYVLAAAINLPPRSWLDVPLWAFVAPIRPRSSGGNPKCQCRPDAVARALGMTRGQAVGSIILPQALRHAIPG